MLLDLRLQFGDVLHVVGDEEGRLQPLDGPAQHARGLDVGRAGRAAAARRVHGLERVHDREPAVELAAGHVVGEQL